MAFFDPLSNTTDETATATLYALLKGLRAKVTRATVRESLLQHPDFPSLLSLSDVLTDWQIENTGLQLNTPEQLCELPLPFVAHLRKNNGWYVLVMALQGDSIIYTDNAEGRRTESLTDFEKKWSGGVLLAEANEQSGEAEYTTTRRQERLDEARLPFVLSSLGLIAFFVILTVGDNLSTIDRLLFVTKLIGLGLSGLLVAKQVGATNALTDRLCRINSKTNCDGVLNSPGAKLWGWLSWADVGLLYFAGGLLTMFLIGVQPNVFSLLHRLALLALPYTLFSVYYQGFVLRQWCPLCLGVQGVLLIEGILAATHLNALPPVVQPYILILSAFLLPTLAWVVVKPLLINLPKSRREHEELMWLKRNPDLFRALLLQQPQMPTIPDDLHPIVVGNPEAEHTITVVTNPYCGPCARTHKELEDLLQGTNNLKAEIIFACDGIDGAATQVAVHAIGLTQQGNAAQALANWYEHPNKNFNDWTKRYPIISETMNGVAVANRHCEWCHMANIRVTPTVFVNGHELPEQYRIGRLKWLIDCLPVQTSIMDLAKSK